MKYLASLLFGLLLLSGCSTTSHQAPEGTNGKAANNEKWKSRQVKLSKRNVWKLTGRASVTYDGDNWPFGIEWQQLSWQHYTMQIKHPVTQSNLANIKKTGNKVTLESNGRTFQDSSAEKLIETNLRLKLPVKGMQYWVLGTASPDYPITAVKLDARGRPLLLKQAGWDIRYSDYKSNRFDALPSLIKVSRLTPQPVQIKMRIRQWQ